MMKFEKFLEVYDSISEDMHFLCASEIRLKILKAMVDGPKTMKELNNHVLLSYSSISNNLRKLVSGGFLEKIDNKFYLTNIGRISLVNYVDFNQSIEVTEFLDVFMKTHDLSPFFEDSLKDLANLNGSYLVESVSVDIYRPHNEFKSLVSTSNKLKIIFPYLHPDFPDLIKDLISKKVSIELLINEDILSLFISNIGEDLVKNAMDENLISIKSLVSDVKLSLAISDTFVSIGLFKKDGHFDQNRLIISDKKEAISWAEELFKVHSSNSIFVHI